MIQFQEITRTDSRIEGRTGGTSLTAADWHLKVKGTEYDVGLTKTYGIRVNMEKISSIHKLILKTGQILGSHELNSRTHF